MEYYSHHQQQQHQQLSPEVRTFTSQTLPSTILSSLLTCPNPLYDLTVKTSTGKIFDCHRCILSASSPVFHAMFQSSMSEQTTGVLNLPSDIPSSVFQSVLSYLYGRPLKIHSKDVIPMSTFIRRYEVGHDGDLINFMDSLLISGLCMDNVLHIKKHAKFHNADRLIRASDRFICVRLRELYKCNSFLISNVEDAIDTLKSIRNCSKSVTPKRSEEYVFDAVTSWLLYKNTEEEKEAEQEQDRVDKYLNRFLDLVWVGDMSLPGLVKASKHELATKSQNFQSKLLRAFTLNAERYVTFNNVNINENENENEIDQNEEEKHSNSNINKNNSILQTVVEGTMHTNGIINDDDTNGIDNVAHNMIYRTTSPTPRTRTRSSSRSRSRSRSSSPASFRRYVTRNYSGNLRRMSSGRWNSSSFVHSRFLRDRSPPPPPPQNTYSSPSPSNNSPFFLPPVHHHHQQQPDYYYTGYYNNNNNRYLRTLPTLSISQHPSSSTTEMYGGYSFSR